MNINWISTRYITPSWRLALGLFLFHITSAGILSAIAHSKYLPSMHNGAGLWNFALDSIEFHRDGVSLATHVSRGEFEQWITVGTTAHVKLIALCYALFGADPITFMPINALVWMLSVCGVYGVAKVMGAKSDISAIGIALLFGLWPSNFVLSTQLLKDPFYNFGCILFFLGWIGIINNKGRCIFYIASLVTGLIVATTFRTAPLPLLFALSVAAIGISFMSSWREGIIALVTLILASGAYVFVNIVVPQGVSQTITDIDYYADKYKATPEEILVTTRQTIKDHMGSSYSESMDEIIKQWVYTGPWPDYKVNAEVIVGLSRIHGNKLERFIVDFNNPWVSSNWMPVALERRIISASKQRDCFVTYYFEYSGSTLDEDIFFRSVGDIAAYLPRAMQIAMFSPFPNMWYDSKASSGKVIRLISGIETLVLYILWCGLFIYLWRAPRGRALKVWMVLFFIVMIIPLGLFVPNVGTLYRMRYVYLLPVIIGGALGWLSLKSGHHNQSIKTSDS